MIDRLSNLLAVTECLKEERAQPKPNEAVIACCEIWLRVNPVYPFDYAYLSQSVED